MTEIVGRQQFFELQTGAVGCLWTLQETLAGTTYMSEFVTLLAYMDKVANLHSLPATKFKDITPRGETVKEYEFKSKHLRIYAVQIPGGKVVVLGGFKTNQPAEIAALRRLKVEIAPLLSPAKTKYPVFREGLLLPPEYWIMDIQTKLYEALQNYQQQKGFNRTQLAEALGYSKGYISQILNGNFDHRMSTLVELSLKMGLTPEFHFKAPAKEKKQLVSRSRSEGEYPFQWLRRPAKSAGRKLVDFKPKAR